MAEDEPYDRGDDVLGGIDAREIEGDDEPLPAPAAAGIQNDWADDVRPVKFRVVPEGEPQDKGTEYSVVDIDTDVKSYAGKVMTYGSRRGLSRASNALKYDRFLEESSIGAWAHFMWPSVMGESNGRYISINAWDRAHFTWGFYQLAAHTPRDNLILLMRELVRLPPPAASSPT